MKLFHVATKYEGDFLLTGELLGQLPRSVMLMGTIQFKDQLPEIKKQIEAAGKEAILFRGVHDEHAGQVLGCDIFENKRETDAYLYIGDGLFHPTALLYDNNQAVYYYNPFDKKTTKLTQNDLVKVNLRRKAGLSKFYASSKIGVLVTTKPGQQNFNAALELKRRLKGKKEVFIFADDTLSMQQLENFPFIQCWINTACPRIIEDTKISMINMWDLRNDVMKGYGVKVV